jgi:hypothetical protein
VTSGLLEFLASTCFMLVSCLAYSSTRKMEVTSSYKLSAGFEWTTWHHIPEDKTLHNDCYENLKSCILYGILDTTSINSQAHSWEQWSWEGSLEERDESICLSDWSYGGAWLFWWLPECWGYRLDAGCKNVRTRKFFLGCLSFSTLSIVCYSKWIPHFRNWICSHPQVGLGYWPSWVS